MVSFFALKILSKLLGLLFLDFKRLYWLVFLLGDPMTVLVVALTAYFINKSRAESVNTKEG